MTLRTIYTCASGVIAMLLTSCEPGYYEKKLYHKTEDHLARIQNLNESIEKAEAAMKSNLPVDFTTHRPGSPEKRNSIRIDNQMDFILLQKRCEVDQKWLEANEKKESEELLSAIAANNKFELQTLTCLRFPTTPFQFSKSVSNFNQQLFAKPSTTVNENRTPQNFSGVFGDPLEKFINPPSVDLIPEGYRIRINAAIDPDQQVIQLEGSFSNFSNPDLQKVSFLDQTNAPSTELFAMVVPTPKSESHQNYSVRVPVSQWLIVSTLPASEHSNRVSLHFIKVIEVN